MISARHGAEALLETELAVERSLTISLDLTQRLDEPGGIGKEKKRDICSRACSEA